MPNVIMLGLLIVVIATSVGVYFWFTRRLRLIEDELWGVKRQEAETVARQSENDETQAGEDSGHSIE